MAETTVASGNQVKQWDQDYFKEYVRGSLFNPYMGKTENALIQVKEQLGTLPGNIVSVPLITRLTGDGVSGDDTLRGNEEALGNYNHDITVNQIRNAVSVKTMQERSTAIDLRNAAKTMLMVWNKDKLRDRIIKSMMSPVVDGNTAYADATEAQKDAWTAYNADRILFGAAKSNNSANDHSVCLANVDSTNDKFTAAKVSLMKRMAKTADPHIRPIQVKDGREWYVIFCGSLPFRDLKADLATINQNAQVRGDENPLFTDGDLTYDGCIIREVPEIPVITGVGAGSIDVGPIFLCGAQALGLAWGERSHTETEDFDYNNEHGVAVAEVRGMDKLVYNNIQLSMVTGYMSAVADS